QIGTPAFLRRLKPWFARPCSPRTLLPGQPYTNSSSTQKGGQIGNGLLPGIRLPPAPPSLHPAAAHAQTQLFLDRLHSHTLRTPGKQELLCRFFRKEVLLR